MTTYKGIQGFAVQSVVSDPSTLDETQVWYNNATYAFKLASATTVGTFASGGNLNTGRLLLAGFGTQTAAVAAGGYSAPDNDTPATELYNGTAWTNNPTGLGNGRREMPGVGTQTAGLVFGGFIDAPAPVVGKQVVTESWNGSTWSPVNSMNTARNLLGGFGIQTAAVAIGGLATPETPASTVTETWNGTSWTTNPTGLNTGRRLMGAAGIQTAGLAFGGDRFPPPAATITVTNATESWNGSVWTNVNSMNTSRFNLAGAGTLTAAVAIGGAPGPGAITGATETWNGTSWTSNPNSLSTPRGGLSGQTSGTQTLGIVFGGETPPISTATEEFTGPGSPVTKTITIS
jgi:hypothetical protein